MEEVMWIFVLTLTFLTGVTGAVTCGSGWLHNPHHDTCVKARNSLIDWFDARDSCSREKSTLLHVDSDDMKKFLKADIKDTGILSDSQAVWIASNDIVTEWQLRSVFRREMKYTSWKNEQPNDHRQDGANHTQNCVMDMTTSSKNLQEDKNCSGHNYQYVCEQWPRDMYSGTYRKINPAENWLINYGLASTADDIFGVPRLKTCALRCLDKYFYCDLFVYSSTSLRCKLLRLYEEGNSKAFTVTDQKNLVNGGYEAFVLHKLQV